jgi:hypothetical protein
MAVETLELTINIILENFFSVFEILEKTRTLRPQIHEQLANGLRNPPRRDER